MSGGRYPPGPPIEIVGGSGILYGEPRYPGRGYLPRPGEDRPALSPWARLSRGGALGKKASINFRAGSAHKQRSLVSILSAEGDDADARQLTVTLLPPLVVPEAFEETLALLRPQNRTGEQNNFQIQSRPTFPGLLVPIQWPPIEAIIEWGVGGTSSQVAVDFVNGSTVNVVASYIRVFAAIVSGEDIDITGTSATYVVSAFVGPGFPRPGSAQKTTYIGQVDSLAESAVFAVPRFAKSATVVGCDPAGAPIVEVTVATLRFWQSPDGSAGGNNVGNFVISGAQPQPFDVPAGAAYATVINGMSVASRMSILYNLSI